METPDNFQLSSIDATEKLAKLIAPHLVRGDMIALSGDLGTGKTEFARALLHALGVGGDVPSPTFTLAQAYDAGGLTVTHFDLYRLKSASELEELGWDDALAEGVVIVEWPERAERRLPFNRLELHFSLAPDGTRSCAMEKFGNWNKRLGNMP